MGHIDFKKVLLPDPLGMWSKDKDTTPSVPAAPASPSNDAALKSAQDAAAEAERRRRAAGGGASNILTSPLGDTSSASTASARLLGG